MFCHGSSLYASASRVSGETPSPAQDAARSAIQLQTVFRFAGFNRCKAIKAFQA